MRTVINALREGIKQLEAQKQEIDKKLGLLRDSLRALDGHGSHVQRRGHPPGSKTKTTKKKATRNWSPEARKAAAERAKRMWAKRKASKKTKTRKASKKKAATKEGP